MQVFGFYSLILITLLSFETLHMNLIIYISEAAQFGETGGKRNTSASYYLLMSFPNFMSCKSP